MKPDLHEVALADLLPHASPMILITNLIEAQDEYVDCEVTINEQSLFYDNKACGVPAWVGIEYMAQSIGVHAGVQAMLASEPIKIGLLLGCRRFESEVVNFNLGQSLRIRAQKLYLEESGLAGYDCNIYCQNKLLCSAKLNVFSPQSETDFFS